MENKGENREEEFNNRQENGNSMSDKSDDEVDTSQKDSEDEYENSDDIEKLKLVHEKLCSKTQTLLQKIKSIDEKLNMILVFNAALFVLLIAVFPISVNSDIVKGVILSFTCLFVLSEIATILLILIAMFPRKYRNIALNEYSKFEYYNRNIQKIYEQEVNGEWNSAKDLEEILASKSSFSVVVTILTMINLVFIMIAVLLNGLY